MRLSSRILIGEQRIRERVDAMAGAIAADTPEGAELSVLCLLDGAFMFCADLVRLLPMPVRIGMMPLPSVERGGDPHATPLPAELPIRGQDLLVVEDILDTGQTMSGLLERLHDLRPSRVRLAVLLDKPTRRVVPVRPDYVGFTVEDTWVVGYGLDSSGLYRNLPYISFIEQD